MLTVLVTRPLQCLGWGCGGLIGNGTLPWSLTGHSGGLDDDEFASFQSERPQHPSVPDGSGHAINSLLRLAAALSLATALVLGLMCDVVYFQTTHVAGE